MLPWPIPLIVKETQQVNIVIIWSKIPFKAKTLVDLTFSFFVIQYLMQ